MQKQKDRKRERKRERVKGKKGERRSATEGEREGENEKEQGHTRAHTHTYTHTSKRAHDQAHTSISQCALTPHEVKGHTFIFIRLGCLEILHMILPPTRPPRPRMVLGKGFMLTPTLSYRISPLPFRSLFLVCSHGAALDLSTFFALAPLPLVLADAAAAAVFALALPPLVLAEVRGLAGLLNCRRMWRQSCGQARRID